MGTLSIEIDVTDAEGRNFTNSIDWQGTAQDVRDLMKMIEDVAYRAGVTPEQFAQGAVIHLPKMGLATDPVARRGQMNAILWLVLQCPAKLGTVADHVSAGDDVKADLTAAGQKIHVALRGGTTP
jgi:hypothetical protein